jgi:hypothetical protein
MNATATPRTASDAAISPKPMICRRSILSTFNPPHMKRIAIDLP